MRTLPILVLGTLLLACTAKISSDLTVDGKELKPTACRSGQPMGFAGVELRGSSDVRVRLFADPAGYANAVLLGVGPAAPVELGRCGSITVETQNSTVNDVRNVKGTATLECTTDGHSLKGKVTFENCH
jgi:hypothetical protein